MFPNTAQTFGMPPKSAPAAAGQCVWALRVCTDPLPPGCLFAPIFQLKGDKGLGVSSELTCHLGQLYQDFLTHEATT